jgi:hypothetical protein
MLEPDVLKHVILLSNSAEVFGNFLSWCKERRPIGVASKRELESMRWDVLNKVKDTSQSAFIQSVSLKTSFQDRELSHRK